MAFATASNQIATLKELYVNDQEFMQNLVYSKRPLLAMIPKEETPIAMGGKYLPVPVVYANNQGRSATFVNAQTNQAPAADISFFVYRIKNYGVITIENELLESTKGDAAAFIEQATFQVNSGINNFSNDLHGSLYGDGTGFRGGLASISTGVITLTSVSDVVNFEINMALVSYSVSGNTATQSTGTAVGYVIAVNRTAGTVTVASSGLGGSAATPTNWSASFPNLAVQGDINFASNGLQIASGSALKVAGLAAWIPKVAPAAGDNFWGVDRSADPTRLGGLRYDGSAQQIEEALIDAGALAAREGADPRMCFMNYTSYAALVKGLGAKAVYTKIDTDMGKISFDGVQIICDYGVMTVVPDAKVPATTAYMLSMDSWKLRSNNKAPHLLTYGAEGLDGIRVSNADALEMRIGLYGNLVCNAPGHNVVVTLSN